MRSRRAALFGATLVAGVTGVSGTAFATHSHFVIITNPASGEVTCQYLAAGVSEPAPNHPLHTKVHMGRPGSDSHGTDFDKDANFAARCT